MRAVAPLPDPSSSRAVDEEHVVHALLVVATAFATLDAEALRTVYASDADWIDATGRTLQGSEAIIGHLRELFAAPHFAAGSLAGPPTLSLRWLDGDAVVATTCLERRSQHALDGRTVPPRRTHSLKVLTRRLPDGWQIVSDLYADARDDDRTSAPIAATTPPPSRQECRS
jgi:ketosteroid isomerase-like protein